MSNILSATHKDKDGNEMLISQMSDSHLLVTIRLIASRAEQALRGLESGPQAQFSGALRYAVKVDQEALNQELEKALDYNLNALAKYVFDAARRGLDVSKELQRATGLTGQVQRFDHLGMVADFYALPEADDYDD